MNLEQVKNILLVTDEPSDEIIKYLNNCYNGWELLSLYENLEKCGKLHPKLPHYNIFKNYNEADRFVAFPGYIGLESLSNPKIRDELVYGKCSVEIIQNLSALNEHYKFLEDNPSDTHNQEKNNIIKSLIEMNCPIKLIPNSILSSEKFLSMYLKYNSPFDNSKLYHEILTTNKYTKNLEERLLEALKTNSLENHIRYSFRTEADSSDAIETIDLEKLVVSKLYTLKLLDRNYTSIGAIMNNEYQEDIIENGKMHGYYSYQLNLISMYPFWIYTLKELITDSSHEAYHAIQENQIKTGDIVSDPDIDIYSMDKFLSDKLGSSYYEENYDLIGTEFDAEFKAKIDVYKLDDPKEKENDIESLCKEIERLSIEEKTALEELKSITPYFYLMSRKYGKEHLSIYELFKRCINTEYTKSNKKEDFIKEIYNAYPIFKYMLKITPNSIEFNTPLDYLNALERADSYDANIYLQLIVNDFNPMKKNKKTRKEYFDLLKKHPYKLLIIKIVSETINKYEMHLKKGDPS